MKLKKYILILTTTLLASSCTDKDVIETPDINNNIPLSKYALSCTDIFKLSDNTRSATTLSQFEYLTYKGDTVLYLLHKGNGFELYPSDQRFAPVIAFNEHEDLNLDSICPAQAEWIEQLKENIYNFRHFDSTTVNANIAEWNHVLHKPSLSETRFIPEDDNRGEGNEKHGGWVYHGTRVVNDYADIKNHLLNFWLAQGSPYNTYCPKNSYSYNNCVAGCGPIAAALIICYLKKTFGWPTENVSLATYNKSTNSYSFSNWSNKAWSNEDDIYKLIGNLGVIGGTKYGDNSSSTKNNAMSSMFRAYNVSCQTADWNSSIIRENISKKTPILTLLAKKDGSAGHAVVVDGYQYFSTTYIDTYIYVEDLNEYNGDDIYDHEQENPYDNNLNINEGPSMEEEYTSTSFYFQINWGWGKAHQDNSYYHESAIIVKGDKTYDGNKQILYNFKNNKQS